MPPAENWFRAAGSLPTVHNSHVTGSGGPRTPRTQPPTTSWIGSEATVHVLRGRVRLDGEGH
jgi:hypothetical protein